MKRKLFSMLFAVSAALVSVSGLTACGGGGGGGGSVATNNQNKTTPMTIDEFVRGQRCYKLINTVYGFVGSNGDAAQYKDATSATVKGTFRAGEAIAPDATLIYQQLDAADGASGSEPSYALTISFQFTTDLDQQDFLAVLGADLAVGENGGGDNDDAGATVTGGAITLTIAPDGTYTAGGNIELDNDGDGEQDGDDEEVEGVQGLYLNMNSDVSSAS